MNIMKKIALFAVIVAGYGSLEAGTVVFQAKTGKNALTEQVKIMMLQKDVLENLLGTWEVDLEPNGEARVKPHTAGETLFIFVMVYDMSNNLLAEGPFNLPKEVSLATFAEARIIVEEKTGRSGKKQVNLKKAF